MNGVPTAADTRRRSLRRLGALLEFGRLAAQPDLDAAQAQARQRELTHYCEDVAEWGDVPALVAALLEGTVAHLNLEAYVEWVSTLEPDERGAGPFPRPGANVSAARLVQRASGSRRSTDFETSLRVVASHVVRPGNAAPLLADLLLIIARVTDVDEFCRWSFSNWDWQPGDTF